MRDLLTLGQMLTVHARLLGHRIGVRDLDRAMTFREWNARSCRLANALLGLGLSKGDRVAILAYNCVEWAEIYAATAKAGLVAVPINFRLLGQEVRFIVENAEASALIVQDELAGVVEEIRTELSLPARPLRPFRPAPVPGRIPRLRRADGGGQRRRTRSARPARRSVDADVHLGHHGKPQGRCPQPPGR